MSLGGYVAEKTVFGDLTTGPSNDLQVSTAMARDIVTKYGMSEILGPVALEEPGGKTLFGRGINEKEYSEEVSAAIDREVSKIMKDAYNKAVEIIEKHRQLLDIIASRLIEKETLERDEFDSILVSNGIQPKKKE
jgi:cell division protease FtsH